LEFDENGAAMKPIAAKNQFEFIDRYQQQLRK
jgi:hypothetical protein